MGILPRVGLIRSLYVERILNQKMGQETKNEKITLKPKKMKTLISNYSLWIATIMLAIIAIYGTYEYYYNMPKWFSDPPVSFEVIRKQTKSAQKIWIPLQLLFLISFVTALVSNWQVSTIRTYLIFAGIAYLIIIISTGAYFAREIIAFTKIPTNAPKTANLIKRANLWYQSSMIRNVLQFIALVLILIANYKKFKL